MWWIVLTTALMLVEMLPAPPQSQGSADSAGNALADQVRRLVIQLNDDRAATRDAAEQSLLELAGNTASQSDRVLELLPTPSEAMPLSLRERVARLRQQIENRAAKFATTGTTLSLDVNQMPLAEVIAEIRRQTGNRLLDRREQFGGVAEGAGRQVTLRVKEAPFWSALDQLLDAANLSVYNYGGEDGLALIPRGPDDGPRHGAAVYNGPFRIDVVELQSQVNLRQPARKSLSVKLEVAWEPRLRPIALSQPVADVSAVDDTGRTIPAVQQAAVMNVEVPTGTQAAEIILPFALPERDAKRIALLKGRLQALVPGRVVQFKFDGLDQPAGRTQSRGGVHVTLEKVQKNNAIWEVHMRFRLDEANRALESHRGWVFQNITYLVDGEANRIEQVGLETTLQTPNEVGMAYFFDLPEGKNIEGLTWVYETPAVIVEMPVTYEIKDIVLP